MNMPRNLQLRLTHNTINRGWMAIAICLAVFMLPLPTLADEITNSVGIKLRLLDAGRFEMGERDLSPGFYKDHAPFEIGDVTPRHPVVLSKPFYLAATEVTIGQFRQFVKETDYKTSAETNELGAVGWDPKPPADNPRYVSTFRDGGGFNWKKPGFDQGDNHPVCGISFEDAQAFCAWLSRKEGKSYRLPTEAEWEYAARAGTETYFSFGDTYRGVIQRFANIGNVELERAFPDRVRRQWLVDVERDPADKHVFTAPVGSYEPNPWGLFDMYGNVWEWCEDRYLDTAYAPYTSSGYQQVRKRAINPLNTEKASNAGEWRVIRGGSWFNAPIQCRSSVRGYFEATDAACYVGFRVALDPPEPVIAAALRQFDQSEAARSTLERLADRIQERRDGRLTVSLNQQRERLTDEFLAALQSLDEAIDLHLDGRGSLTAAQLAELAKTPQLKGLLLANIGPNITDADFAFLAQQPQLELLQLTGAPQLSDALFPALQHLQRLELLQLEGTAITDDGLMRLAPQKSLKTVRLNGTASQGLALDRFRGSPLERFACDHLSDAGGRILAEFPAIQELSVTGSPLTGRGLEDIARLPRLQRLELNRCRELRDEDLAVLGNVYGLTALQLTNTAAGDRTADGLTKLNNLRELQIGSEHLSDAGVRKLCEIVSLKHFTITAEAVNLTDDAFLDLWRLNNLNGFNISAPSVTGSGLQALHELPQLEWLNLEGTGIRDAALEHVAASEAVQRLFVGSWQRGGPVALTDAGLLHLAKARKLTKFALIRRNTKVTDEGTAELRRRRPELSVDVHNP